MEEIKEQTRGDYGLEVNRLQVPCKRPVTGADFPRGVQDYDFSIGGRFAWRPSKSYFRVGLKITDILTATAGGAETPPTAQANLAFADNPVAGMFDNVYVRAGNADVSSIINYAPQAHQVKARLSKSRAWLNGIGKSALGCDADFQDRVNTYASNGITGEEHTVPSREAIAVDKTATLSLAAATGIVTGVNTVFTAADVGKTLVINERSFTVGAFTDATHIVVAGGATGALGILPDPYLGTWSNSWFETPALAPPSENKNIQYFMYQPPVGIFDHDGLLGSGEYRIQLNPNSRYKDAIVESITNLTSETNYNVSVESLEFYPCIEKANLAATGTEKLYLTEQHVQTKTLTTGASSSILDFTVPPSTTALSIFVQFNGAGTNNIIPLTTFKALTGTDENLTNIQVTYANVSKPSTNWSSEYAGSTNFMTQRYIDTQIDSGMYYSAGGPESFPEWRKRGGLYHFDFTRDSEDRSTNVQLNMTFGAMEANTLCYVCAHYTKTVVLSVTNGRISNVQQLSV